MDPDQKFSGNDSEEGFDDPMYGPTYNNPYN